MGQRYIASELATQRAVKQIHKTEGSPFDEFLERELHVSLRVVKGIKISAIVTQRCLSPKTVNSDRDRVFNKLSIKSDVELTHFARQYGLLEKETQTETV